MIRYPAPAILAKISYRLVTAPALIGAIFSETALVGALGTIPAVALIGAVLYETVFFGALGTIPVLT